MSEFKIIPQAPDYKISKDEEVRRVANDSTVFVLSGDKVLLKKPDGSMEHFFVGELVKQLFSNNSEVAEEKPQKHVNPDPIEENPVAVETPQLTDIQIEEEQNETNESEDKNLSKDEPVVQVETEAHVPIEANIPPQLEVVPVKRGRGRPAGSKNGQPKAPKEPKAPKVKKEKAAKVPKEKKVKVEKVKKEKIAKVKNEKKPKKELPSSYPATKEITHILSLDCSDSVKIWKLSEAGCAIPEILFHLKQKPIQGHSARGIICRYRNNKNLKAKAEAIK